MEPESQDAPKRTGTPARVIELTGCLMPWDDLKEQPAMLQTPGSPFFYVPVFSEPEKLAAFMGRTGVAFHRIKQITDGPDFMTSFSNEIKVMHDPYFTDQGRVRWAEIQQG